MGNGNVTRKRFQKSENCRHILLSAVGVRHSLSRFAAQDSVLSTCGFLHDACDVRVRVRVGRCACQSACHLGLCAWYLRSESRPQPKPHPGEPPSLIGMSAGVRWAYCLARGP